ncbi:MAG TPA: adenine phosphoribosyltransferase [Candidatus Paceibacterota bacterium]|nr:adenine phosphoribosyltransferase [Candidatus Paceibacterota bacterium]
MTNDILERAASLLRPVPDFPKPGILFFDLNPLLRDMVVMDTIATEIANYWQPANIDVVAGFDSRGFLFGPMVAERLNVPFTMVRKQGKLPPPTKSVSYGLEYGEDVIEMADDGFIEGKRVLLIDDLLATGGTAEAGVKLVSKLGGEAVGYACVSELPELGGRAKLLDIPVQSLITIMDDTPVVGAEYCVDVYARCVRTGALMLIERLDEVPGIAMPGGRIEERESVRAAAGRELEEETGNGVSHFEFIGMLTGLNRDPRGPKVSIVLETMVNVGPLRGEVGVTRPFWVNSPSELPDTTKFVFAHDTIVYNRFLDQFADEAQHAPVI